jgi:hypothetical protein
MASDTLTQSRPTMCPEIVYIEQLRCALRDLEDDMTTIRFTVDFLREEIERGERDRIGTHQRILVEKGHSWLQRPSSKGGGRFVVYATCLLT